MSGQSPPPPVWLDHLTLSVPDFAEAVGILRERFGLNTTVTPQAPDSHGRILLDRSYIEVAAEGSGDDRLSIPGFVLGCDDVPAAIDSLAVEGLAHAAVQRYRGADGDWWDGMLAPPEGVPAPLIVQRHTPPEIAATWPPPLPTPHPSGIVRLSGVFLVTVYVAQAVDFYRQVLGRLTNAPAAASPSIGPGWLLADRLWNIALPASARIAVCDPLRPGPARDRLIERGPGIVGFELTAGDLAATRTYFDWSGVGYQIVDAEGTDCLWIDPEATPGIVLAARAGA